MKNIKYYRMSGISLDSRAPAEGLTGPPLCFTFSGGLPSRYRSGPYLSSCWLGVVDATELNPLMILSIDSYLPCPPLPEEG